MAATATPTDSAAAQNRLGMSNRQATSTSTKTTGPTTNAEGCDKALWGTENDKAAEAPIDDNNKSTPEQLKHHTSRENTVSIQKNTPAEDTSFSVWVVVFLGIP